MIGEVIALSVGVFIGAGATTLAVRAAVWKVTQDRDRAEELALVRKEVLDAVERALDASGVGPLHGPHQRRVQALARREYRARQDCEEARAALALVTAEREGAFADLARMIGELECVSAALDVAGVPVRGLPYMEHAARVLELRRQRDSAQAEAVAQVLARKVADFRPEPPPRDVVETRHVGDEPDGRGGTLRVYEPVGDAR